MTEKHENVLKIGKFSSKNFAPLYFNLVSTLYIIDPYCNGLETSRDDDDDDEMLQYSSLTVTSPSTSM